MQETDSTILKGVDENTLLEIYSLVELSRNAVALKAVSSHLLQAESQVAWNGRTYVPLGLVIGAER